MNINGPDVPKGNGDQYAVRTCASGVSGCTGKVNDEFDPLGYIYLVRVQPAAVGHPITLQLYDPAFVATDDFCAHGTDRDDRQRQLERLRHDRRQGPLQEDRCGPGLAQRLLHRRPDGDSRPE